MTQILSAGNSLGEPVGREVGLTKEEAEELKEALMSDGLTAVISTNLTTTPTSHEVGIYEGK